MHADITVLHVEDDAVDARLTKKALLRIAGITQVHNVPGAGVALSFLKRLPPFVEAPKTDLLLLDFHLPDMNAADLLEKIQLEPELRTIPVVVVSGAEDPRDILECYRLGACAFVQKPTQLAQYEEIAHAVERFWQQRK